MNFRQMIQGVLACLCAVFSVSAFAAPDVPAVLGLPGQAAPVHYDFGSQSALTTVPVVHTFHLRNGGSVPLTVTRLQASCGCTTAVLTGQTPAGREGGAIVLPLVLASGASASVHVSVDPGHLYPGTVSKDVWVYVQGQAAPAATLEINGTVVPAAAFAPVMLDFSRTPAGKAPALTLTVTLDPHAFAAAGRSPHPVLTSSSQDLLITEVAPEKGADVTLLASAASPSGKVSVGGTPTDEPPVTKTYQVRLSPHARLGMLNERLALFTPTVGQTAGQPIPGASVPVLGEVTGEIGASPETVVFGMVSAGRGGIQRVTLTAATPQALRGLTLFSASPAVTLRLLGPDGLPLTAQSKPAETSTLEVTVTPQGPGRPALTGSLQTQVLVTTADGQQLALPVFVSVSD